MLITALIARVGFLRKFSNGAPVPMSSSPWATAINRYRWLHVHPSETQRKPNYDQKLIRQWNQNGIDSNARRNARTDHCSIWNRCVTNLLLRSLPDTGLTNQLIFPFKLSIPPNTFFVQFIHRESNGKNCWFSPSKKIMRFFLVGNKLNGAFMRALSISTQQNEKNYWIK